MDKLLELLRTDGNLSPDQLAEMLNTSAAEVQNRIQRYERERVILGYRAIVNDEVADPEQVKAAIEISISPERSGGFNRTAERIARFEQVDSCFLMSGGYDLLLFVHGKNLREVASFVSEKLATLENVRSTATHFILKTYKRHGVLMTEETAGERLKVAP
ncbi:MAG: Lrp/AsnC family transcriptional regulator [Verrucomicrobiae bacterium]|nr:Lrp/AsnC family transcriptional regulator [Verrucomicrobiae bacterium]